MLCRKFRKGNIRKKSSRRQISVQFTLELVLYTCLFSRVNMCLHVVDISKVHANPFSVNNLLLNFFYIILPTCKKYAVSYSACCRNQFYINIEN